MDNFACGVVCRHNHILSACTYRVQMLRRSSLGAGGLVFSSVQNRKLGRGQEEGFETVIRSSASPGVHYIVRSSLRGRADTSTRTAGKPLLGVLPPNISEQMQLEGTQLPIGGGSIYTLLRHHSHRIVGRDGRRMVSI